MFPIELLIMLVFVGVLSGVAGGLFGIGGGVLIVPLVLFLTQLSFREAVAVSLAAIAVSTPMGLWTHHRAGQVHWRRGIALGISGLLGLVAAIVADPFLGELHMEWGFAAFLVFAAHRLAYGSRPLVRMRGPVAILIAGFSAGLVAKLLGVGGGIFIVSSLVFAGFDIHAAVATSLVVVLGNTLASTATNLALLGPQPWLPFAAPVAAGSVLGMWVGSRTGLRTRSENLQRAFAVFLVLMAMSLVYRSLQ